MLPVFRLTVAADSTKGEILWQSVRLVVSAGMLPQDRALEVLAALLAREERGSTGIGDGFAVPHTTRVHVSHTAAAIIRLSAAVPFESLDRQPVHTLGLVVSPADRPQEHLRSLEAISDYLREQGGGPD